MAAIEFDAQVTNGTIEVPASYRQDLQGSVHVIVFPRTETSGTTKIDELIANPLQVPGFTLLTRDEAHERR